MLTKEETQQLLDESAHAQATLWHKLRSLERALTELNGGVTIEVSCMVDLQCATVDDLLNLPRT